LGVKHPEITCQISRNKISIFHTCLLEIERLHRRSLDSKYTKLRFYSDGKLGDRMTWVADSLLTVVTRQRPLLSDDRDALQDNGFCWL